MRRLCLERVSCSRVVHLRLRETLWWRCTYVWSRCPFISPVRFRYLLQRASAIYGGTAHRSTKFSNELSPLCAEIQVMYTQVSHRAAELIPPRISIRNLLTHHICIELFGHCLSQHRNSSLADRKSLAEDRVQNYYGLLSRHRLGRLLNRQKAVFSLVGRWQIIWL
jgi:hypothetical protein